GSCKQDHGELLSGFPFGVDELSVPRTSGREWTHSDRSRRTHLPRRLHRLVMLPPPAGGVILCPPVGCRALRQGMFQAVGVLESVLRALGQTAKNDAFEIGGGVRFKSGQRDTGVAGRRDE